MYTVPPVGVLRFSIWSAGGLGSNKHDPYVRIKSGKQVRSRTEILDNTDCPEWGEFHYVPIHNIHENLVLELMDWSSGNKDKSIGSTVLDMNEIITQRKGENNTVWYDALTKKLDRYFFFFFLDNLLVLNQVDS
jgi:Ca2+-dependent lipid-binding protein